MATERDSIVFHHTTSFLVVLGRTQGSHMRQVSTKPHSQFKILVSFAFLRQSCCVAQDVLESTMLLP